MSWLRKFIVGLLTNHVGTKFLSLLLTLVLFVFVQQSLTGIRDVPELVLEIRLAEEMQERYVLLTPELKLQDLRIQGLRSKVNQIWQQLKGQDKWPLVVTESFLAEYGDGARISMTPRLVRDEIFEGVPDRVDNIQTGKLILLDQRVKRTGIRVTVAPDTNTTLKPGSKVSGTLEGGQKVDPRVTPANVTLEGPSIAFPAEIRDLYIADPDINEWLFTEFIMEGESKVAEIRNVTVDWKRSGIGKRYLDRIEVLVGEERMSRAEFESRVVVSFEVRAETAVTGIAVVIRVQSSLSGNIDLTQYESQGALGILQSDIVNERVREFQVVMPVALKDNQEFLANLVLVLDLANAVKEKDALTVPIFLGLKGPDPGNHHELLKRVRIHTGDTPQKQVLTFVKKKKKS